MTSGLLSAKKKKEPNLFHDFGLYAPSMKRDKEKYISHIMQPPLWFLDFYAVKMNKAEQT